MKKLYQKATVHPSPPSTSTQQPFSDHHLAFLPAAIFTLTVALSTQDKEVLAYLISCSTSSSHKSSTTTRGAGSSSSNGKSGDHPTHFSCNCFRCYMSYWVKWDSSPNRQLIHEIIDAFEDSLAKKEKNKRDKKKKVITTTTNSNNSGVASGGRVSELPAKLNRSSETEFTELKNKEVSEEEIEEGEGYIEKGSVRKIVSFLGERIWGVWT